MEQMDLTLTEVTEALVLHHLLVARLYLVLVAVAVELLKVVEQVALVALEEVEMQVQREEIIQVL
jgi:hypothetical protein